MITEVDSCILIDIFSQDVKYAETSALSLDEARDDGDLIITSCMVAEISPLVGDQVERFLSTYGIQFSPMTYQDSLLAGKIYREYLNKGGKRGRIVPDFLIASHAHYHADRLLTRDKGFSRTYFPSLEIFYRD